MRSTSVLALAISVALCGGAPLARADVASRVAVIDSTRLWAASGITRWVAARAKLDGERATYVAAENPAGKAPDQVVPSLPDGLPAQVRKDLRKLLEDLNGQYVKDQVWHAHELEVLAPIEAEVKAALERYARGHGIGLVLDRSKLDTAVMAVAAGVDLTDAFIKDYNATTKPPAPPKR